MRGRSAVKQTVKNLATIMILCPVATMSAGESWSSFQNGGRPSRESQGTFTLSDINWEAGLQGYGQSSPIVWDNLIYVTTVEGDNKEQYHVTGLRRDNGIQAWQYTVENASPRESSTYVSRAAPTPVADSDGVICFFEGGNVVALTHTGGLRWERNLVEDYGDVEARHGLAASLEQDADSVFVWIERGEDPYIASLNKSSGDTEWKSAGLGTTSWSSPRLIPVDGGQQLVLSASGQLAGLDPSTGKKLWSFDDISGNTTPTPMPLGNGRFLMGASVGRGASAGTRAPESNGVIQIHKKGDGVWGADYLWRSKRATSSFGSPVADDGMAYFVNRAGVLYGLQADSGEEVFAKRLKGGTWATPIAVGQQVFFFGRDGKINILDQDASNPKLSIWDGLPKPGKPATPQAEAARSGPSGASGPVLYAAVWCENLLMLRRGDRLFAVNVESERN
jgi:outer membrane protein assembly factor BamB